ncbi:hypothetical protein [Chitinophaga nivalis]|uniref:Uncharacterized protein n=1 Tax=Chitinophaga nivalis TaxID=2991709 RepID=A0ABT3IWC2_9BACT|nr:hypothetical protein [Chitinophaga nivalis]MCW3462053.1 hypothetical protein [Chitinophaga nivalis]MCW3488255.1 hypothetical protein [Chitinophaga nivalis]
MTTSPSNVIFQTRFTHSIGAIKTNKAFPEYPEFNARLRLDYLDHTIKRTYRKYRNDHAPSQEQLKGFQDIVTSKKGLQQISFFSYCKGFNIHSEKGERISPKTKQKISPNTNKGYVTTLSHLEKFQKTIPAGLRDTSI